MMPNMAPEKVKKMLLVANIMVILTGIVVIQQFHVQAGELQEFNEKMEEMGCYAFLERHGNLSRLRIQDVVTAPGNFTSETKDQD